jgi:hypothetical protein
LHTEQAHRPWKPGFFPQLKIVAQSFPALAPENVDAPAAKPAAAYLSEEAAALHARRTKPFFAHCGIHDALATDIAKPSLAHAPPCDSPSPVGKLNALGLSNQL